MGKEKHGFTFGTTQPRGGCGIRPWVVWEIKNFPAQFVWLFGVVVRGFAVADGSCVVEEIID